MPWLINSADHDLFAPQVHQNVPGRGHISISDAEAVLFEGNSVLRVITPPAAEVFVEPEIEVPVEESTTEPEPVVESEPTSETESAAPVRRQVTRGGQRAEVDGKPPMETR